VLMIRSQYSSALASLENRQLPERLHEMKAGAAEAWPGLGPRASIEHRMLGDAGKSHDESPPR